MSNGVESYRDWMRGQVVSANPSELKHHFVPCKHCGSTYTFETPCPTCASKGHTQFNCEKCEIFYAKGKIPFSSHFCEHCRQEFKLRSVECHLCPACFEAGHRGKAKNTCPNCADLQPRRRKDDKPGPTREQLERATRPVGRGGLW